MQHIVLGYMQISNEKSARDAYHLKNTAKICGIRLNAVLNYNLDNK